MKNNNILVTATTFPRYENDKQPSFVKDLSQELLKLGLNVHVLVPHDRGLKLNDYFDGLKIHRFFYFIPKFEKLAYGGIIPNIKKNKLLILQFPFLFLFQLFALIKSIKTYRIKILHSHWIVPQGLSGAIAKKFFNIKHVLTIHGGDLYTLIKIPFGKSLIKFVVNNCDNVTCVNHELKNLLNSVIKKDNVSVIPMGVNIRDYKEKYKFNKNILFLGRLAEKKGIKYLIEAIKLIDDNIKVSIAGDGPLKKELEDFSKKNDLQNKIKFLGYVYGKEKINLIKNCGIFVLPSIITEQGDREGLPVSLLEAMAAGKAIIATNVGGIKEIIRNNYNGLLIEQKNSKEIASSINKLMNNKNLAKKIGINAKKTVLDYDWIIIGKRYYNILKR